LFYENNIATSIAGLATSLSRGAQFVVQLKGVFLAGLFTFIASLVVWHIIKTVLGLRVSEEEKVKGLDIGEHDNEVYPKFQIVAKR
jgi:ammonium transporter, Amt family